MKKAIIICLVIIALLLVGRSLTKNEISTDSADTQETAKTPEVDIANNQRIEKEIYSENGVSIVVEYTNGEKTVEIRITNHRNDDFFYEVTGVSVNRCMVYDYVYGNDTVTPGKTAILEYDISAAKDYGIKTVEELSLGLRLYDSKDELDETIVRTVAVSDTQAFNYVTPDYCFYDDDCCSAFLVSMNRKFSSFDAVYYNKTDETMSAFLTDVSINGVMLDAVSVLGYSQIFPGCYAYTGISTGTITIYSALENEIREKGLENVETMEGKLVIWGNRDYKTDEIRIYPNPETE